MAQYQSIKSDVTAAGGAQTHLYTTPLHNLTAEGCNEGSGRVFIRTDGRGGGTHAKTLAAEYDD